jgi:replication-associated recombination protein RarA
MGVQLAIKYRPGNWSEVIGQDDAVARLLRLRDARGLGGRAYWLTGGSGTGKSTLAQLIGNELADPSCVEELDAGTLTPARLVEVERTAGVYGMGEKTGRVWIVNEAHGLSKAVVRQLLVFLERLPGHVAIVFTTTNDGQEALFEGNEDAHPLTSRCLPVPLARRDLAKAFATRAQQIAQAEGLDGGKTPAQWLRLVQDKKNNLRAVLQAIDAGEML